MDKLFVKRLIQQLYHENDVANWSLTDYQVAGFTSLMLHRSPEMNIRLYVSEPGKTSLAGSLDPKDNTLWIHNHRFAFQCQTLMGRMGNVLFEECNEETRWGSYYKYMYQSALQLGTMRAFPRGEVFLDSPNYYMVKSGESYYMDSTQLHKIWVPDDELVVLLFWEFQRSRGHTMMYSKEQLPFNPDTSELYTKMSNDEVHRVLELVCGCL